MTDDIKTQFIGAVRTGLGVSDELADLRRQLAEAKAKIEVLRGQLERRQWTRDAAANVTFCPSCGATRGMGHASYCPLAAALAETEQ